MENANKKPKKSVYIIVASKNKADETKLEDAMLLARRSISPDQLKWTYETTNKKDSQGRLMLHLVQILGYFTIITPQEYYWFTKKYIGDEKLSEKGTLPKQLKKFFYVYDNLTEAQEKAKELAKLQETYYNSLPNSDKIYANPVNIFPKDYLDLTFDYIQRRIVPDIAKTKKESTSDEQKTNQ